MRIGLVLCISISILILASPIVKAEPSDEKYHLSKTAVVLKIVRKGAYWYRIVDTGVDVFLGTKQAVDLGLTGLEIPGHVFEIIALEVYTDVKDISTFSRYIAVNVLYKRHVKTAQFVSETVVPFALDSANNAGEFAVNSLTPSVKDTVSQSTEFISETMIPNAVESAVGFRRYAEERVAPAIVDATKIAVDHSKRAAVSSYSKSQEYIISTKDYASSNVVPAIDNAVTSAKERVKRLKSFLWD